MDKKMFTFEQGTVDKGYYVQHFVKILKNGENVCYCSDLTPDGARDLARTWLNDNGAWDVPLVTRDDVEKLKANWEGDPIWDLEDTEGYQAYRDELKAFSEAKHAEWQAHREERERRRAAMVTVCADKLGCSYRTAAYILALEERIKRLENEA